VVEYQVADGNEFFSRRGNGFIAPRTKSPNEVEDNVLHSF